MVDLIDLAGGGRMGGRLIRLPAVFILRLFVKGLIERLEEAVQLLSDVDQMTLETASVNGVMGKAMRGWPLDDGVALSEGSGSNHRIHVIPRPLRLLLCQELSL